MFPSALLLGLLFTVSSSLVPLIIDTDIGGDFDDAVAGMSNKS